MYNQTLLKVNLLYCLFQYQPCDLVIEADILQRGLTLKTDLQKWLVGFKVATVRDSSIYFSLQMKDRSLPDSLADMTQLEIQFNSLACSQNAGIYRDRADHEPGQL